MKGKRFLSLLLSLALTVSLAVPALADEFTDYYAEEVETYRAAHPGELEELTVEGLLEWQGYTETLTPVEQYMKGRGLTSEEEVLPALLWDYVSARRWREETHAQFLTYQEHWAEQWEKFDADAYFEQEWSYSEFYDGKEGYRKDNLLLSEEEFAEEMFVQYVLENSWEWENENWYWDGQDYERVIILYANGEPVDADVTAVDGKTYADPAVLNEIMGTQFPDSDPISIRYAAETAGWDVVWNSYRRQVILLDREKLLTGVVAHEYGWMEEDISGLDRLLERVGTANPLKPGQSYQTTGTLELTYTALNSLDGDEEYTAQIKAETLSRDKSFEMTLTMDLADVLRLVPETVLEELKAELPKSAGSLKTLLGGVKVNLIWDGEAGALYVNAPIMALVDPASGMDGDVWYSFDLSELLEMEVGSFNGAEVLYEHLLERSGSWSGAESAYSDFVTQKGLLYVLFGPHAVTEKNGTLTWKLDEKMISAALGAFMNAMGEPGNWDRYSLFRECRLELTIGPKGETGFDMALRPDMEGITAAIFDSDRYYYYDYSILESLLIGRTLGGLADFRMAAHGKNAAGGGDSHMELHWKNRFKLELDMDSTCKEVKTAPRTVPPETAEIVEVY